MTNRSRIIFTVTNDLNYDQRMHRICNSLANHGYDVLLIGREKPTSVRLSDQSFSQLRLKCHFQKGKPFYFEFNLKLLLFLLGRKAEAICAIDLDTILPCWIAGKVKNAKRIYDAHEYFPEVPEVINRPIVKKIWQFAGRLAIPKMDLCYTVSESLSEIFQKKYGKEFHIIRNVPPLNPLDTTSAEKFILYQGALNEGRGLETLINAMRSINIPLYIAGEGDLSQKLRGQVKSLGLENKVHFFGYISPNELKKLTAQAFVGYNLLENKSLSYYYSLANKFFDYIHAGVPSLTNNFPEYKKISEQFNVAFLIEMEEEQIIEKINELLGSTELHESMVEECYKARKILNWEEEEKLLLKIYEDLFK